VVTDSATCGSTESTMTGQMTGNATYDRALDAAFGTGMIRYRQKRQHGNRAREGLGHVLLRKVCSEKSVERLHNAIRLGKFRHGQAGAGSSSTQVSNDPSSRT
jgi:hypothetical protein